MASVLPKNLIVTTKLTFSPLTSSLPRKGLNWSTS